MSMTTDIFEKARQVMGQPNCYIHWLRISNAYERLFFAWNDFHGPLNEAQRAFFVQVVCDQLQNAGDSPAPTLPSFLHRMKLRRTDEDCLGTLKMLRESQAAPIALPDEILGRIGE